MVSLIILAALVGLAFAPRARRGGLRHAFLRLHPARGRALADLGIGIAVAPHLVADHNGFMEYHKEVPAHDKQR
jgi:signal transduction histidine kinase